MRGGVVFATKRALFGPESVFFTYILTHTFERRRGSRGRRKEGIQKKNNNKKKHARDWCIKNTLIVPYYNIIPLYNVKGFPIRKIIRNQNAW